MKVYKFSVWYYVYCMLLFFCFILMFIYLADSLFEKVLICLLVFALIYAIIDMLFTEFIVTESTISMNNKLWSKKTEINFSDITHIFRTYPKDKIFLTVLIMTRDKKIGLVRMIGRYKELLHTVLIKTKGKNSNASIDILVLKLVDSLKKGDE